MFDDFDFFEVDIGEPYDIVSMDPEPFYFSEDVLTEPEVVEFMPASDVVEGGIFSDVDWGRYAGEAAKTILAYSARKSAADSAAEQQAILRARAEQDAARRRAAQSGMTLPGGLSITPMTLTLLAAAGIGAALLLTRGNGR